MVCSHTAGVVIEIEVWQVFPAPAVGLQVHDHRRSSTVLDQVAAGGIRQHRHRATIGTHVSQPLRRIGRIQRHIRTACLQHRQQRHHHLDAALHADRHPVVRAHAQLAQVMRQLVGLRIQLAIRQRHLALHHRDGRWIALHLSLEQFMHTGIAWIIRRRCIPLRQHLMPLVFAQQWQMLHCPIFSALGHHRIQQVLPMPHPAIQRRTLEQRYGIVQTSDDPLLTLGQRQRQIELRTRLRCAKTTGFEFAKIQLALWRVLPGEHHLEQRCMRQAARRLYQFHHLFERNVLMRLCLQGTFLHRCQ